MLQRYALALSALLTSTAAHADLSISNKPTQNMSCNAGVCTATAKNATLNTGDLANLLASGNVTIKTGGGAQTLVVRDGFSWSSNSGLTLSADRSIEIDSAIGVSGTGAALTLSTDHMQPGGDLVFGVKGHVDFLDTGSTLILDGVKYTLVPDIATLVRLVEAHQDAGNYALANDYDASADGVYPNAPVGVFVGVLEGLGHRISNLSIAVYNNDAGFFWFTVGATVRDLGFESATVSGGRSDVGTIIAEAQEGTSVIGCWSSGSVTSRGTSGGLLGGTFQHNLIARSHSSSIVKGKYAIGGIVGAVDDTSAVDQSYATGKIIGGQGAFAGGLVGTSSGALSNSYATGSVKGKEAGGLAGTSRSTATSYSIGKVAGTTLVGGLLGAENGTAQQSYWDLETSGISNPAQGAGNVSNDPGITGLSDAQLKSGLPAGFDPKIWGSNPNINNGYPYLLANPPR